MVNWEVGVRIHVIYVPDLLKSPKPSHPIRAALSSMGYLRLGDCPAERWSLYDRVEKSPDSADNRHC